MVNREKLFEALDVIREYGFVEAVNDFMTDAEYESLYFHMKIVFEGCNGE